MAILKYFIERRFIKVVFSKVKNATGGVSTGCKISLPKKWMDAMGLSADDREMCVDFDSEKKTIVISKAEECDKIVLSKEILKKVGANSTSEFLIHADKNEETIILTKV